MRPNIGWGNLLALGLHPILIVAMNNDAGLGMEENEIFARFDTEDAHQMRCMVHLFS